MSEIILDKIEKKGSIKISEDVIAVIAGTACFEVENVLLSNKNKKQFGKNVSINMSEDGVDVSIDVVLKMGCSLVEVCEKIQEKIENAIEAMTNLKVNKVNVNVIDLKEVIDS